MKALYLILAVLLVSGTALPLTSHAARADGKKAKLIAKYDQSGNGVIDGAEMAEFRKDFAADEEGILKGYDKDENGELSDEEIMAIKPGAAPSSEKKGKKAKTEQTSDEKAPSEVKQPEARKAPEAE